MRAEVDDQLVERWNQVSEVWRTKPDFRQAVTVEASLAARSVYGGTAPEAVQRALVEARALLAGP